MTSEHRQTHTWNKYFKNPSWVWGRDRIICPEDHRLASQGLPSDDKRWSWGTDFSVPTSQEKWFFFLVPLNTSFNIRKTWKRLPGNPTRTEMWHGDVILTVQWRHGWLATVHFYLTRGLVRICEKELSRIGKKPKPRSCLREYNFLHAG